MSIVIAPLLLLASFQPSVTYRSSFGNAADVGVVVPAKGFEATARDFVLNELKRYRGAGCLLVNAATTGEDLMLSQAHLATESDEASTLVAYRELKKRPFPAMRLVKIGGAAVIQTRNHLGEISHRLVSGATHSDPLRPVSGCEIVHITFGEEHPATQRPQDKFGIKAFVQCSNPSRTNGLRIRDYLESKCGTGTITLILRTNPWFTADDFPPLPPFVVDNGEATLERYFIGNSEVLFSDRKGLHWQGDPFPPF